MGSDHNLGGEILEGKRAISDHLNDQSQHSKIQSDDTFVVDMESFSLTIDKLMNISPTTTRNLSRKGSTRVGDSILNVNQRVTATLATSSRGMDNKTTATSLHEGSTLEMATEAAADDSAATLLHHQITISNGAVGNTAAVESKSLAKKFRFRSQSIDPRRMFLFFATMSSLGTMLLIYFTLSSTSKLDRDDVIFS